MMNQTFTRLNRILGLLTLSALPVLSQAQNFNWSCAGPIYSAGRARNMVVDKVDVTGKTLYVGSTSSGIFKTTDGGSNWVPMDDQGSVRNISYMAQSFDGTIYAGTGEGFLRAGQKAKAQVGTGLYKLNASSNLVVVADSSKTGTIINRIACHPGNKDIIVLATNKGILISTDAGANFNTAAIASNTPNVTQGIDVKFNSAGILFCTIGSVEGSGIYANIPTKIYRSDAALSVFTDITPTSVSLSDSNYGRIELGIAPSNPNVIYASCAKKYASSNSAVLQGLFVTDNAGSSWALITQGSSQLDPLSNGGTIATGDYSQVLYVNPTDPGQLFIGGYFFYIWTKNSNASFSNPLGLWTQIGSPYALGSPYYLHENIHDIRTSAGKFYFITDAGVYRSSDMNYVYQNLPPSFQPFYKGLVTGQFNSVSIESHPLGANVGGSQGTAVTPYSGFIGGTGANGLAYFSGNFPNVTKEISYLSGEVYNVDYSKILSDAAILTRGSGSIYRTTNATNSAPTLVNVNYYTGHISKVAPSANDFSNNGFNTTGTPFKMWENYGQLPPGPDNAVFYNDSTRFQASMVGLETLTTQTTFTFSAARPNKFALIDSIVIRTATVVVPGIANVGTPFQNSDKKDLLINFTHSYSVNPTTTTPAFTVQSVVSNTAGNVYAPYGSGPSNSALHGATLNAVTNVDKIAVTFSAPPFATKTQTYANVPDPASYYRVFATVFYKYKAGDTVQVIDNNISTKTSTFSAVLTNSLSWRYGTAPSYTLSAPVNTSIPNSTFVLTPGSVSSNTSSTFVVNNWLSATYTITQNGTYTLNALPVQYSISATSNTALASSYTLYPGTVTQTTGLFVVSPSVNTTYTITQGTGTNTADTYSTVNASTFVLNPGNVTQNTGAFVVSPTVSTTYTIDGISSNTLIGVNTTTSYATLSVKTTSTVGYTSTVPFAPSNGLVKIPMHRSARLAMALNVQQVTGSQNAIVVSKAPLNLNDPLNFVRISQSKCLSDDAQGVASSASITIPGKPTIIEWSKSGTELYYATDDNKLYRVSHITDIMDLSPSSYSGKFFTDVFAYNSTSPYTPNDAVINPMSPYRTTLIGSFTKPITSISISKDDTSMALTFNNPAATGTTGIVLYSNKNVRKYNSAGITWNKKDGTGLSNVVAYCSLLEKSDNKKMFVGTDNGLFYTPDISAASPSWQKINNNQLPNVQIFDIEQQVLNNSDCYNSGQIYVATNGRGVWTNSSFLQQYVNAIDENSSKSVQNNISLYPNPSNGLVTIEFPADNQENTRIQMFDLNGRLVKSIEGSKDGSGMVKQNIETSDLNPGIYIISVSGDSNVKRAAKLIVTK
ncbi:MAG TPA: T9SS type A sorting domain-containing protein [Bacteroidia bacterium]|nr:T9SS type A sorting domain-containing protein [Bacteroidia bacterium]